MGHWQSLSPSSIGLDVSIDIDGNVTHEWRWSDAMQGLMWYCDILGCVAVCRAVSVLNLNIPVDRWGMYSASEYSVVCLDIIMRFRLTEGCSWLCLCFSRSLAFCSHTSKQLATGRLFATPNCGGETKYSSYFPR